MAGRESGESGPFRDDRSEEQPAKLAPINLRFSRAAEAFNPAFNAASACRLRLRRQPVLAVTQGFKSLCYWALRDLMQVGGYRPQFRPHRGVICMTFAWHCSHAAGRYSDHTPMRSHREDRVGSRQLSA